MAYTCYKVIPEQLFAILPPKHENVFAEHITCEYGVPEDTELPSQVDSVVVVGIAENDKVQALVVKVGANTQRPDGRLYHITLSTADGIKPFESNMLLESEGFSPIEPIRIDATPFIVNWS